MDHEAALALARQVGEIAAAHAAEGEANGSLHPDVVNAMVETGLIKLLRPKLFGGYELQPWTYVEVVRELGRYDPAAAWVYSIFEIHEWWLAYANPALQEEIWGVERPGLIVDAIAPVGRAERVDGGWKVAGRWKFLSGIDWAEWVAVDALAQFRPEGPPEPALFVLKKDQVRVERDWNVVGMRGTASNSVTVEDAVFRNTASSTVTELLAVPRMPTTFQSRSTRTWSFLSTKSAGSGGPSGRNWASASTATHSAQSIPLRNFHRPATFQPPSTRSARPTGAIASTISPGRSTPQISSCSAGFA